MKYQSEIKNCQNCKNDFVIENEDFSFYEKIKVPPPTFCSECRMIRRFHFRNERLLFRRPDAHTGEDIFSGFPNESDVKTYENNYWFGSDWDKLKSGVGYDFSKPFFAQFKELLSRAPLPARSGWNMINSDYCHEVESLKNCYLCFNVDYSEDSAYLRKSRRIKNSLDLYECESLDLCYEDVMTEKSFRTFYSVECDSCVDVWFSKNCRGCTNCFGCVGLRNQSYCYFNEQLSKEEYSLKMKEINTGSFEEILKLKKRAEEFWLKFPIKYYYGIKNLNVTGDKILNSKNLKDCYYAKGVENLAYCQDIWGNTSSCYDFSVWGDGAENIYECMTCGLGIANLRFCFNCWEGSRDLEYCGYVISSDNCFGCVGLHKKQYCILNKQYFKEEYFEMVEKIKKHMNEMPYVDGSGRMYKYGEFFPFEISPFSYNESLNQDFFPLNKESVEKFGYVWREPALREFEKTILAGDLPDEISEVTEDFLKEIIECNDCKKAFRVIPSELQFYKQINLPLPRLCHGCRFVERFKFSTAPKFYDRKCMKKDCLNKFRTPYSEDHPEIVYCEKCYQAEVY